MVLSGMPGIVATDEYSVRPTIGYQTGPISCKKQGIVYIKSYFIINSGSFKCYMGTLVTNLQLLYIRMGVTRLTG